MRGGARRVEAADRVTDYLRTPPDYSQPSPGLFASSSMDIEPMYRHTYYPYMRPIQILMDEKELKLIDREAKRVGSDRSKLMREAVRRYLSKLIRDADEREYVESYRRQPEDVKELRDWSKVQTWPAD